MIKRLIYTIIALMTVALLGLMVIQAYWIRNAFRLKEAEFSRSVEATLSEVVVSIEKLDAAMRLRQYKEGAVLYRKIDSLNFLIDKRIGQLAEKHPELKASRKNSGDTLGPDLYQFDNGWRTIRRNDTMEVRYDSAVGQQVTKSASGFDPQTDNRLRRLYRQRGRVMDELVRRSFIMNDVFHSFMDNNTLKPIEERLKTSLIDSLLRQQLESRGINTQFEFGVYIPSRNILTLQRTGQYPSELLTRGFPVRLFPGNKSSAPSYLLLYFPNEITFVISQIGWLLLLSGLLIVVIIYAFGYTILSIIRQKRIQDMKTDFINNMTHEFKTPVSTIALACEALCDKELVKSEEMFNAYINIISEENQRLGKMAEKVLEAASLEKGKLRMKQENLNLHDLINDVVRKISIQVTSREGTLVTSLDSSHDRVVGDRLHLTNMIYNLIDNAIKYSPDSPVIDVSTTHLEGFIRLSVRDQGIGISKRNQKKIFDKLYRVPTGDLHDVKGYGLGLSYVRAIVENHGGTITVNSELHHGSEFVVNLPVVDGKPSS